MISALRFFVRPNTSLFLTKRLASTSGGEKTSLYDFHVQRKGKMVNFAGYLLPVQYEDQSIASSHLHTRSHASIFDVSHMLQTYVRGRDAIDCFESICSADIVGLDNNNGTLTVFTNDAAGILDDLIVSRVSSNLLYVVSNAACKKQDSEIIRAAVERYKALSREVDVEFLDPSERALLALQGPAAANALQQLIKFELKNLYFMQTTETEVAGVNCRVTRCGYTGEDGFEISIPADKGVHIAEALLDIPNGNVKLAGLGARDSLRLEAGLCLYGSDIDSTISPVEAALTWLVPTRRRAERSFPGAMEIVKKMTEGVSKRRVGFRMSSGPPARHGSEIFFEGQKIGEITSGCPSPSLGGNVAMGYVEEAHKKIGTKVALKIRDKMYPAEIAKMPFVKANYYQKPKNLGGY